MKPHQHGDRNPETIKTGNNRSGNSKQSKILHFEIFENFGDNHSSYFKYFHFCFLEFCIFGNAMKACDVTSAAYRRLRDRPS